MYAVPYLLNAIGSGTQLKGIQTGSATILDSSSSGVASIAAITLNKGFLVFQYDSQQDWDDPDECMVSGQISSTTQLTFARSSTAGQINIRWWVIEFKASSGVTVQRGSTTFSAGTNNVTISAVNLANAFPIISYRTPGDTIDQNHFITADLTSTTNLQLQAYASVSQIVEWQVIENPSWTVAKYTDTLTGTTLNTTISAIVLAQSFLVSSGRFSITVAVPGDSPFQSRFTSTTNVQTTRVGSPSNSPIVFFVVSNSRIQSQHLQYSVLSGSLSNTQAISAITVANSFLLATCMNVCQAVNTSTGDYRGGRLCLRHTINSSTQIQATRQIATNDVLTNVSAIDFSNV